MPPKNDWVMRVFGRFVVGDFVELHNLVWLFVVSNQIHHTLVDVGVGSLIHVANLQVKMWGLAFDGVVVGVVAIVVVVVEEVDWA